MNQVLSKEKSDQPDRRKWIKISCATGVVGSIASAIPFVASMAPSDRAKAAGAPVEVDINSLKPGEKITAEWRGKPVWILYRTKDMLESLTTLTNELADPESKRNPAEFTPSYARNQYRSRRPEFLVVIGICTHLGCSPIDKFAKGGGAGLPENWQGGFFCPCHGSTFDLAGRVYKNQPAPDNLAVPPYQFVGDHKIVIGIDETTQA